MHRHLYDPKELNCLLPEFSGGEFILKKGRGKETLIFDGKIERVVVPDLLKKTIIIHSHIVYERWLGCNVDFSDAKRWKPVDLSSGELAFDYSWFYRQPRHARLKLESVETHNRCWLCSHTEPIYLELFRTMLMRMFLEESLRKESLWKKMRNRFMK